MSKGFVETLEGVVGRSVADLEGTLKPAPNPSPPEPGVSGVRDLLVRRVCSRGDGVGSGDGLPPSPSRTSASIARSRFPFTPFNTSAFRF